MCSFSFHTACGSKNKREESQGIGLKVFHFKVFMAKNITNSKSCEPHLICLLTSVANPAQIWWITVESAKRVKLQLTLF